MEYLYYVVAYLVLLNIITTYRLLKTEDYEATQKIIQFLLLWILPLAGALLVTFFLNQSPIVLGEKIYKFRIILKILLFPWFIKITFRRNNNSLNGVSDEGYKAETFEPLISYAEGGGE